MKNKTISFLLVFAILMAILPTAVVFPKAANAENLTLDLSKTVLQDFKNFEPYGDLWYNASFAQGPICSEEKGLYFSKNGTNKKSGTANLKIKKLTTGNLYEAEYLSVTFQKNSINGYFQTIFSFDINNGETWSGLYGINDPEVYYDNGSSKLQKAAYTATDDNNKQLTFNCGASSSVVVYIPYKSIKLYDGKEMGNLFSNVTSIGIQFTNLGNKGTSIENKDAVSIKELAMYQSTKIPNDATPAGDVLVSGLKNMVIQDFAENLSLGTAWPDWNNPVLDIWYNSDLTNTPVIDVENKGLYISNEGANVHGEANVKILKLFNHDFSKSKYLALTFRINSLSGAFKVNISFVANGGDVVLGQNAEIYYDNGRTDIQKAKVVQENNDPFSRFVTFDTAFSNVIKVYVPISSLSNPYTGTVMAKEQLKNVNSVGLQFDNLGNKGSAAANADMVSLREISLYAKTLKGDITFDDELNSNDLREMRKVLLEVSNIKFFDANEDNRCNIIDLVYMKKRVIAFNAGIDDSDPDIDYTAGSQPVCRATEINGFVRRAGKWIVDEDGDEWFIKGGDIDCGSLAGKMQPNLNYCNEELYRQHAELGCNTIRLTFNWELFFRRLESYRINEDGYEFIRQNVEWAKKYGIRLILNMHRIPGVDVGVTKDPEIFWSEAEQYRWIVAWQEMARRFANEPVILGYSLWNEQCGPIGSSQDDAERIYGELYQKCIDAIRTVDKRHIIVCEQLFGRKNQLGQFANTEFPSFPPLKDTNIMYEYHNYDPVDYTFQGDSQEYGIVYKDPDYISSAGLTAFSYNYNSTSKSGAQLNNGWTTDYSKMFSVSGNNVVAGSAIFEVNGNLSGNAALDIQSIAVEEYDGSGNFTKTVYSKTFTDKNSAMNFFTYNAATFGYSDGIGISLSNSSEYALIQTESGELFRLQSGYKYRVVTTVRGRNLASNVYFKSGIKFMDSKKYGKAYNLCKEALKISYDKYIDYRDSNNVPVFCGEWGAYYKVYDEGLNSAQWAEDMLNVLKENNLYFCVHTPYAMYSKALQPWHYEGKNPLFKDVEYTVLEDAFKKILPTI